MVSEPYHSNPSSTNQLPALGELVRRDIREEYANSRNFCDGDIFQQLRSCQRNLDHQGEGRWLARLSEAKRKDLK